MQDSGFFSINISITNNLVTNIFKIIRQNLRIKMHICWTMTNLHFQSKTKVYMNLNPLLSNTLKNKKNWKEVLDQCSLNKATNLDLSNTAFFSRS